MKVGFESWLRNLASKFGFESRFQKFLAVQSYSQSLGQNFVKLTQPAELVCSPKSGELHSNSPRLCNLSLVLTEGLNATKIELQGLSPPTVYPIATNKT